MLSLYTGTPGSGKTLHAVSRARWHVRRRKPVISNVALALDADYFTYRDNKSLTPQYLRDFSESYFHGEPPREDEILLIVDEAQLLFNSRNWDDANRMKFLEFLSQHRHLGYEIILIAQSDAMSDKQFRALVEYEVKHHKLCRFSWLGKLLSFFGLIPLHIANTFLYSAKNMRIGSDMYLCTKSLRGLYDTYAMLETV